MWHASHGPEDVADMQERERAAEQQRAAGRGGKLLLPDWWTNRPRATQLEEQIVADFIDLVETCGGNIRIGDARNWLEMRGPGEADYWWPVYRRLMVAWHGVRSRARSE